MKGKILYYIIGGLTVAIIVTGIFMIINKNNSNSNNISDTNGNGGKSHNQTLIDPNNIPDGATVVDNPDGSRTIQLQNPDGSLSGAEVYGH